MDAILIGDIVIKLLKESNILNDFSYYFNKTEISPNDENTVTIIEVPVGNIDYLNGNQLRQKKQVKIEFRGLQTGIGMVELNKKVLEIQSFFHSKTHQIIYDNNTYKLIDCVVPNQPGSPSIDPNDRVTFYLFVEILIKKIS